MAMKRAKTFNPKQFEEFLAHVSKVSPMPARDRLITALSFKAGLRIGEIAKIKLSAMLDVEGNIASSIVVFSDVAKKKRQREVPMHPLVRKCLAEFRRAYPRAPFVAISSQPFRWIIARGEPIPEDAEFKQMSPAVTKNHYLRLIQSFGYEGASTHSGRRTFGTSLARNANLHHCSLRDVQALLGHSRLETTEHYIELSEDATNLVLAV